MCGGLKDSLNNLFTYIGSRQLDNTHMYGKTGSTNGFF